jgi:GT2 family glycosyltransferase
MNLLRAAAILIVAPCRAIAVVVKAVRAWVTLEPVHWLAVADQLAPLVLLLPSVSILHRAHGRALRSGQRPAESVYALKRGLDLQPSAPELLWELGRSLLLTGQRIDAIAALKRAAASGHQGAIADLLRLGERAALPVPQPGIHARQAYAAHVATNSPPPPPTTPLVALFCIRLTGGEFDGSPLSESLASQSHVAWTCDAGSDRWPGLLAYELPLPACASLDPHALAWLNHAAARTGAAVLRADHDHAGPDGRRCHPCLLPQTDRLWLDGIVGLEARLADSGQEAASHVPLVLLTLPAITQQPLILPDADPQPFSVIIPTRDNPVLLAAAISSLRSAASRPDLLQLVIVDNGSKMPTTRSLLNQLAQDAAVCIVPFPEPFNWSRANNLGASHATADRLLFLNDDTEMRTSGWDRILAGLLADPRVGLAGARMLYPDGRIQHAGFVFGMDNGPQHDGRWRDGRDTGPGGRWTAVRETVAVTGAFIAMSRAEFTAAGGFDEQDLAIDFADVDLCLKLQAKGQAVAYCGAITLLHHESVSRGLNTSRAKRRRMRREWRMLRQRWGDAVNRDPFHHPAWARTGAPHDGLQALSQAEVLTFLDSQAR